MMIQAKIFSCKIQAYSGIPTDNLERMPEIALHFPQCVQLLVTIDAYSMATKYVGLLAASVTDLATKYVA